VDLVEEEDGAALAARFLQPPHGVVHDLADALHGDVGRVLADERAVG
jgi:hypothetical protein